MVVQQVATSATKQRQSLRFFDAEHRQESRTVVSNRSLKAGVFDLHGLDSGHETFKTHLID